MRSRSSLLSKQPAAVAVPMAVPFATAASTGLTVPRETCTREGAAWHGARVSRVAAGAVLAIAFAALIGWAAEFPAARRWLPNQTATNPLTACLLITLASALWLSVSDKCTRRAAAVARAAAAAAVVIALVKFISDVVGWEFGIDGWLFAGELAKEPPSSNRMAPRSALALTAAGAALLTLDWRKGRWISPAQILALFAGIIGLLSLVGYAYDLLNYYLTPNYVPMALPTAVAVFILAIGILLARVHSGVMVVVFSDTAAGLVVRRLLPFAVVLPVVLGAVRLLGQQAGWYDTAMGAAHLAAAFTFTFLIAISWTAWILFRIDRERAAAEIARRQNERRIHQLNEELEQRVADRTAELQAANARLRESGRLAHETLDALSAHIAILDENGTIVNVNRAWRDFARDNSALASATSGGVNYLAVCDAANGADRDTARVFAAGVRAVLNGTEESFALEYACHAPEKQQWFVGRVTRFHGAGRTMVVIAHEDVTPRKQAEESLLFQAHLLKHSGEAAMATDLDGTVIYMNDAAEAMYGWPAEEALGRNIMEVTVPEISRRQATDIFARMCQGETWRGEFIVHRRDGTTFPVSVTNTPLRDKHGVVTGIVGLSKDISERKAAEAALRDSEERFRQLAENVQDVFWMVDVGYSRTIYVSPAYERIWGRAPATLVAEPQSFMEPVLPEDRETVNAYLARQDSGPAEAEYRIRRPDGSIRWIHDRAFPVRDENGNIFRIAGIARDISARKQAQIALRQSEAELRALAVRLNEAREEEAARIAREIHDELGQAMTGMTLDVVAAQRQLAHGSDMGKHEVRRRLEQMRSTLDETIAATRRICTELRPALLDQFGLLPAIEWQVSDFENRSEIFCNLKMDNCEPPITGEPATAIFRILQELLTNVARHARATEVSVELTCRDGAVQLTVEDDGIGLTGAQEKQSVGFGLIGIRERALAVGGNVVMSGERDRGTRVVVTMSRQETANAGRTS